jgi:hypothetical protein
MHNTPDIAQQHVVVGRERGESFEQGGQQETGQVSASVDCGAGSLDHSCADVTPDHARLLPARAS